MIAGKLMFVLLEAIPFLELEIELMIFVLEKCNLLKVIAYFNLVLSTILESFSGSCSKLAPLGIHHGIILV
jgi:hypothetical protein